MRCLREDGPVLLPLALLLAWAAGNPQPSAWATHGGMDRLTVARAGPYAVSAWTQPDPPRIGRLSVSVAVMRPENQAPILDAVVRLIAEPIDHPGESVSTEATRGQGANRLLYNADLALPSAGRWQVTISIGGSEGSGSAAFQLIVKGSSPMRWLVVGLGGGAAGLTLVWLARRRRRGAPVPADTALTRE